MIRAIDFVARAMGALAKILALVSVLVCFATLYMRYALDMTYIWLNESYIWANALAIVLGSAYAYREEALVRVDVFYERMSTRGRAMVDLAGVLVFLGPFLFAIGYYSLLFAILSYRMGEASPHPSGMPALYLLKGSILLLAFLIVLQAVASLIRNAARLRDEVEDDSRNDGVAP
ncbi:MAG: TRAP transporter small permease subunit [Hyphomicrobiaceae bacterium]|nr:TRAP transporter small permease subunit [Hyphomicrobiaceae bacterium]